MPSPHIDKHLSAYGQLQLVCAALETAVADAVRALGLRPKNRHLGPRLKALEDFAKKPPLGSPPSYEHVQLTKACEIARGVADWRNTHIHAQARFVETIRTSSAPPRSCLVLFGSDSKPLVINRAECEQRMDEAIRAIVEIQASVRPLSGRSKVRALIAADLTR